MRLLLASDIFPPESGGPATYVVALANDLVKLEDEVTIVTLNPHPDTQAVKCPLFFVSRKNKVLRYFQYFRLLWKHSKNVDAVYAMGPVNAGLPAMIVSKLRGKKFFVKVVGDYAWEQGTQRWGVKDMMDVFQNKSYGLRVEILRGIEKFVSRRATRVLVPSIYLKKIVKGWGVPERKIETVYNAVPFQEAIPMQKPVGEKWIVCVSRLMAWKGLDTLIAAVKHIAESIPEVRLKIVGDGPERKNLEAKIEELAVQNIVELTGNLPHEKALSYTAAADVFVLNSAYEGLSHVLLEAVNANVPVLASHIGGNSEVIVGSERGDLFEYNNQSQMQEKILTVLRSAPLEPWKETEKQEFLEMFSHEIMIGRTKRALSIPRVLMISLDPHLFDENSQVAARVLTTQLNAELFVLVPGDQDEFLRPHPRLFLFKRGKSKVRQFFALWWLGRKLNKEEKFSFITAQDPFFTGLLGVLIKKKKQEVIVQLHGDFLGSPYYKKSGLGNLVRYYLSFFVMWRASTIRAVGERVRQSLRERNIPEEKIYIQPVKVETEKIVAYEPQLDVHRKYIGIKKVFLFLGRIDPVKNLSWLIDVFFEATKDQENVMLLIVGDGPEKENLKHKVAMMNLGYSVIFESWTSDPVSFLKTADALLFPSLSEGYGMVVMEAVAAGCPVIMNDVGVAGYEVKASETVKIIPVENREIWVETIKNSGVRTGHSFEKTP